MSANLMRRPTARQLLSPFAVLLYVYVLYFSLVYGRFYRYVYWDLMNLGTRIIGAVPRFPTLVLYVFGAVLLIAGFLGGSIIATHAEERSAGRFTAWLMGLKVSAGERLERYRLVKRFGAGWLFGLAGWGTGLLANLAQVAMSGGSSLLDIASRWQQSPVIVFVASAQLFFVPVLVVAARTRLQRLAAGAAFIISTLGLGLLGARNLPAKLIVATFLATIIVSKPKHVARFALAFLVLLAITMGVIGAISKAGIYEASASTGLVVALTYSDSLGTVYNLDKIVALTPPGGLFDGKLLRDSILSLIPGIDVEYSSYQIGRYLGGRSFFVIDGVTVERSVSLAPTMLGAPYADTGVAGVAGQMLILGMLFGYLQYRAPRAKWTVPFLVLMAAYVINGVNAGIYGPNALLAVLLAILVVIFDILVAPQGPTLVHASEEGDIR